MSLKKHNILMLLLTLFFTCLFIPDIRVEAGSSDTVVYSKKIHKFGEYGEKLLAVQDSDSGLWGYMDKYGVYKIKPKYYKAYGFSSGLAAVQKADGKFIFINTSGKQAFKGSFDEIYPRFKNQNHCFLKDYAFVRVGNECFLIDKKGSQIGERYSDTSEEVAFRLGSFLSGDLIMSYYDDVSYIIDKQYKVLFTGGKYLYGNYITDTERYQFYDKNGKLVFDIKEFCEKTGLPVDYYTVVDPGYVIVKKTVNGVTTAAMYDLKGNRIINYKYQNIYPINDKYFFVVNNAGKYGIVDRSGKLIVSAKYDLEKIEDLTNGGNMIVLHKDNTYLSFNAKTGKCSNIKALQYSLYQSKSKNCYYKGTLNKTEVYLANGNRLNLFIDLTGSTELNLKAMEKDEIFICRKSTSDWQLYLAYLK